MHSDQEAVVFLDDLKRLSSFSANLLATESIRPETLYTRKAYVYSQFIFNLSIVDGIITLAQRRQTRVIVPLVRALWESWLGVVFVYAGNSHVWVYYLQLQEELKNRKKRDKFYASGQMEEEQYKARNKEAARIIKLINRRYKELPFIPRVIANDRSLNRDIKLRQKCEIIDYYQGLRKTCNPEVMPLVDWYDTVYSHLSSTAHVSVTELNALYAYDSTGNIHVDISGGGDRKYLSSLLLIAYWHHYALMKVFIANISKSKQRIPNDIKAARRRITSAKFREI